MKGKLRSVPKPMMTQVWMRFLIGGLSFILAVLILVIAKDFVLSLPCWMLALFMVLSGCILLYNGAIGSYVVVNGPCVEVERSRLLKRIKAVIIQTDKGKLKIPIRKKSKRIYEGVDITIYMSAKSRIYTKDNLMIVFEYYAISLSSTK